MRLGLRSPSSQMPSTSTLPINTLVPKDPYLTCVHLKGKHGRSFIKCVCTKVPKERRTIGLTKRVGQSSARAGAQAAPGIRSSQGSLGNLPPNTASTTLSLHTSPHCQSHTSPPTLLLLHPALLGTTLPDPNAVLNSARVQRRGEQVTCCKKMHFHIMHTLPKP